MTKGQRVALYVRVSTDGQTVENQTRELQAIAERHGWVVFDTYSDPAVSGTKAKRPAFDRMMAGVARRDFDIVAAWAVDRLGRLTSKPPGLPRRVEGERRGSLPNTSRA